MTVLSFIADNEAALRFGAIALVLATLAMAERRWALRGDARPARRQGANLALVAIDTLVLRLAFPLLATALAARLHASGTGLFGGLAWPLWLEITLAVLVFDAAIYWQHRLLHRIGWLWPLHRVHHSDLALDVTTGVRFHPLEIALSAGIKLGLVAVLGPHPAAVVIFAAWLSAASLFTHADFAFRPRVEAVLCKLVVTPSMHRIHHSVRREETDSNYGFGLSLWDRVFGSYRARPLQPERDMPLGQPHWRQPALLGLWALLLQPFHRTPRPAPGKETSHA
jgi:sterol desaturase/sphingolipid hydroxylase (fatty acid hydroxylase superfamily)